MIRSCTSSTSNLVLLAFTMVGWFRGPSVWAAGFERDPMTMRVVAVNPSAEKHQEFPVRIDLPLEIGPDQILDSGALQLDFDTERSQYFVFKDSVTLGPKETRVFKVLVEDVWFIPAVELDGLKHHTGIVLEKLEASEYYQSATQLAQTITVRLDAIAAVQSDETISRRSRIGAYRRNRIGLGVIKEDIARMEKLLSFTGGPPIPEMMEESSLRSDAPSTTTTWMVIFLIVIFMGLLAGQFFITWQRRLKVTTDFSEGQQEAFPEQSAEEGATGGAGSGT